MDFEDFLGVFCDVGCVHSASLTVSSACVEGEVVEAASFQISTRRTPPENARFLPPSRKKARPLLVEDQKYIATGFCNTFDEMWEAS